MSATPEANRCRWHVARITVSAIDGTANSPTAVYMCGKPEDDHLHDEGSVQKGHHPFTVEWKWRPGSEYHWREEK